MALRALLSPVQAFNDLVLPVGRWLAIAALMAMVAVILLQVFCRVLGSVVDPARPSTASYATWDTILRRMAMRGLLSAGHVAMRGLLCTGHVYGASFLRDVITVCIIASNVRCSKVLSTVESRDRHARTVTFSERRET